MLRKSVTGFLPVMWKSSSRTWSRLTQDGPDAQIKWAHEKINIHIVKKRLDLRLPFDGRTA